MPSKFRPGLMIHRKNDQITPSLCKMTEKTGGHWEAGFGPPAATEVGSSLPPAISTCLRTVFIVQFHQAVKCCALPYSMRSPCHCRWADLLRITLQTAAPSLHSIGNSHLTQ